MVRLYKAGWAGWAGRVPHSRSTNRGPGFSQECHRYEIRTVVPSRVAAEVCRKNYQRDPLILGGFVGTAVSGLAAAEPCSSEADGRATVSCWQPSPRLTVSKSSACVS